MKASRAILLMLAGLAGGIGGRLAFRWPETNGNGKRGGRADSQRVRLSEAAVVTTDTSAPRPGEAPILASRGGSRMRLLMAWLPGAGEDELLRMAVALTGPDQDENLSIRLLMARWAEVNPAAMVKWAKEQGQEDYGWGSGFYVCNAIEAWARVDFESAWAAANAGLPGTRSSALIGLTAVDPAKCLGLLRADSSLMELTGFATMEKVMNRIAAREPAGAAALLDSGTPAKLRRFAGTVALAWAKSDPAAAVAWMQQLDPGVRAANMDAAAKWIAGHAPEQLPALLEGLPAGRVRSIAEAEGFSHLASTDPAAARLQLDAMPASPSRQYCRGLLMKELFRRGDEAGAIALASQIGWRLQADWCPGAEQVVTPGSKSTRQNSGDDTNEISTTFQELMGRVVARDPVAAAAILAKCEGEIASELLTAANVTNPAALAAALLTSKDENSPRNCQYVVSVWSASDPAAAAAWVEGHVEAGEDRAGIMSTIFNYWASSDPPAMLELAASIDQDTLEQAWQCVVAVDSNTGRTYLESHLDEFIAAARSPAFSKWWREMTFSPEVERQLLQRMPEDSEFDFGSAAERWVADEPEAATEWIRGLPPGARRNRAAEGIVSNLNGNGDYEGAFAWAVSLPAEEREDALTETIELWKGEDPAAAEAAIRASALPPEEQQALLDSLPPP